MKVSYSFDRLNFGQLATEINEVNCSLLSVRKIAEMTFELDHEIKF